MILQLNLRVKSGHSPGQVASQMSAPALFLDGKAGRPSLNTERLLTGAPPPPSASATLAFGQPGGLACSCYTHA